MMNSLSQVRLFRRLSSRRLYLALIRPMVQRGDRDQADPQPSLLGGQCETKSLTCLSGSAVPDSVTGDIDCHRTAPSDV